MSCGKQLSHVTCVALVIKVAVCTKLRGNELALSVVTDDDLANASVQFIANKATGCVCVYTVC